MDTGRSGKAKRGPRPRLFKKHRCQADGCHANLATYSFYYQRNHICVEHLKAEVFVVLGVESRFCQRCGLSHPLTEFDGRRKSCRKALEKHNARRKARAAATTTDGGGGGGGAGASGSGRGPAAGGGGSGGGGDLAIPGVADLSMWDPQLAKELEALLHDDPIIGLPPLVDPAAAAAAAAAVAWPLAASLPPLQMHPMPDMATVGSSQVPGPPHVELGCDGEPLSPTLLQLARAGAPVQQQQAVPMGGTGFHLPSLEHLAHHSEGATAAAAVHPHQQILQQQLVGAMALQQQPPPAPAHQQQHPMQFVVLAPQGMAMPQGMAVSMPQQGAFPAGAVQQQGQQQMQWVLMPSNMVMMPQAMAQQAVPAQQAPAHQQQQQQAAQQQPPVVEDSEHSTPHS